MDTSSKRVEIIPAKRRAMILERLRRDGAASILELSKEIGASASTIRRDLEQLTEGGYLERTHGGALFVPPLQATFDALLEQMGPGNAGENGAPMPMVLEPRPGGRWFRDLGNDNGHFWGVVQAIKRPLLLEVTGPLFMSYPVVSNIQYRLTEADGGTLIT